MTAEYFLENSKKRKIKCAAYTKDDWYLETILPVLPQSDEIKELTKTEETTLKLVIQQLSLAGHIRYLNILLTRYRHYCPDIINLAAYHTAFAGYENDFFNNPQNTAYQIIVRYLLTGFVAGEHIEKALKLLNCLNSNASVQMHHYLAITHTMREIPGFLTDPNIRYNCLSRLDWKTYREILYYLNIHKEIISPDEQQKLALFFGQPNYPVFSISSAITLWKTRAANNQNSTLLPIPSAPPTSPRPR